MEARAVKISNGPERIEPDEIASMAVYYIVISINIRERITFQRRQDDLCRMQLLGTFLVSESMNYSRSRGTLTSGKRNRIEDDRDVKAKEMQLRGETGGGKTKRRSDEATSRATSGV